MRQRPIRPNEVASIPVWIFLQIVLVLGLRLPEWSGMCDLGDNLVRPKARDINIGDGIFRDPLPLVAGINDGRPVARFLVVALTVQRRWIMKLEEDSSFR
jgi:hypothetical protein